MVAVVTGLRKIWMLLGLSWTMISSTQSGACGSEAQGWCRSIATRHWSAWRMHIKAKEACRHVHNTYIAHAAGIHNAAACVYSLQASAYTNWPRKNNDAHGHALCAESLRERSSIRPAGGCRYGYDYECANHAAIVPGPPEDGPGAGLGTQGGARASGKLDEVIGTCRGGTDSGSGDGSPGSMWGDVCVLQPADFRGAPCSDLVGAQRPIAELLPGVCHCCVQPSLARGCVCWGCAFVCECACAYVKLAGMQCPCICTEAQEQTMLGSGLHKACLCQVS